MSKFFKNATIAALMVAGLASSPSARAFSDDLKFDDLGVLEYGLLLQLYSAVPDLGAEDVARGVGMLSGSNISDPKSPLYTQDLWRLLPRILGGDEEVRRQFVWDSWMSGILGRDVSRFCGTRKFLKLKYFSQGDAQEVLNALDQGNQCWASEPKEAALKF